MKKIFKIIIPLALLATYLVYFLLLQPQNANYPGLEKGEIYISDESFYKNDDLYLAGDWEFYYIELLDSGGFDSKEQRKYFTLPDYWQRDWNAEIIGNNGFGSYRLKISFETPKETVALNIPWVHGAYEVFSNGKSVMKCGTVGKTPEEEIADVRSKSTVIPLNSDKMELIIHISGYLGGKSGLLLPISLGSYSSVGREIATKSIVDTIFLSFLFIMGFYHLIIFVLKKNDMSLIFFTLFCFVAMIQHGTVSDGLLYRALPINNGFLAYDLYILSKSWMVTLFAVFSYFLFGKKNGTGKINIYILSAFNLLVTVCEIFWKYNFSLILYIFTYTCFFLCIVYVLRVVYLMNKNKDGFRFLYTCGVLLSFFAYGSDILADTGLIKTAEFGSTSLVFFVIFEAVILAKIFVDYSHENERLLNHMETLVDERTSKLAEANEQLRLAEQSKNQLIGNISHDLRTPITAIQGYMQLMKMGIANADEAKEYIDSAHVRTEQMENLIKDLFLLTQVNEKQLQTKIVQIDISEFLNKCYKIYKPVAVQKGIELDLENGTDNLIISTDINFLFRIMDNLVQNALYYARKKIIISGKTTQEGFVLSVIDDGIGIEKKDIPNVFDRFYKKRENGAGLGLFIVKELTITLSGEAFVKSIPGERTEFGIKLNI